MKKKISIALFAQNGICADFFLEEIKINKKILNIFLVVSDDEFYQKIKKIYKKKFIWVRESKKINENEILKLIYNKNLIYAFSVQYKWKIQKKIIENFDYIFNFHFGDIPNYRGHYPIIFAMLNNEKFIKGTVHSISEELDKGLVYKKVKIKNDFKTNYEIEVLMSKMFSKIFIELIKKLKIYKKLRLKKIRGNGKFYSSKIDIQRFKEVKNLKELKIKTLTFDYPPHEPAFIRSGKNKIYLSKDFKLNKEHRTILNHYNFS